MNEMGRTGPADRVVGLTDSESALVATARRFASTRLFADSARWERERVYPREAIVEAGRLGLNRIEAPTDRGGLGMSFRTKLRVAQALAREDMAFSFALINSQNAVNRVAKDGNDAQRARWLGPLLAGESIGAICLTEPGTGSDFAAIQTRATRRAGGWVINGEKAWATNAAGADHALVFAQTDPAAGYLGIAAFMVAADAPGVQASAPEALVGAHAIGAGGYRFTAVAVDDDALFYPPGEAFKRALSNINGARTYVAGMCCAMLERALDLAFEHLRERHAFGSPLWENQGLRWRLADVLTDLEAAQLLTDHAAALIDRDRARTTSAGERNETALAAAHAKKFSARVAEHGLRECTQMLGARGLRDDVPLGRHMVCARVAHYVDGTSEMQNERIAALMPSRFRSSA